MFLHLVDVDERGTATRQRALRAELERSAPLQAVEELLKEFTKARLLVTDQREKNPTVEVRHEALLRKWERLATGLSRSKTTCACCDRSSWRRRAGIKSPGRTLSAGRASVLSGFTQ